MKPGKWIPIRDMNRDHLINAINLLKRKNKEYTRDYYVLVDEAEKRGIETEKGAMSIPFSVC